MSNHQQVVINFVEHDEIKKWFSERFPNKTLKHRLYRIGGRGYARENEVFICKDHFDSQLIAHEVLHTDLCGNQRHPKKWQVWRWFGVMTPSGGFRWFVNIPKSAIQIIRHMRA